MRITQPALRIVTLLAIALFTAVTVRADGIAAFERGDYAEAVQALRQQIAANESDGTALLYLARARFALNDAESAADTVDQATAALPDSADAHYWRGRIYGTLAANASMFSAGKLARTARAGFERALDIEPNHRDALIGLIEFKRQAPKIVGGNKREALALTERLSALDPVAGGLRRAQVLVGLRRDDDAKALLNTLLDEYPSNPMVRLRLGFEQQEAEDYTAALEHFAIAARAPLAEASEEQKKAIYGAMYQLGRSHVFAKTASTSAAVALKRYIEEAPADPAMPGKDWAHYRLAQLSGINGDAAGAKRHYEAALAATDDDNLIRRAKAQLK